MIKLSGVLLCVIVAVAIAGCVSPPVAFETPEGFAQFTGEKKPLAISPEGVVLRFRTAENDPAQDLEFWSEALERQMIESGYLPLDQGEFTSEGLTGVYFEWLAPMNDEDWVYLTGIAVAEDVIVIAEAAGPFQLYQARRDTLINALSSVRLES
jgi:hypothetical protein